MAMNATVDWDDDKHLLRCWAHQDCKGCLHEDNCAWCPFSWSCVPNNYTIPALAPAYDENICPHWAERWEIRTRPLGCQVSTITSLTAIISIVSTMLGLLLIFLIILAIWRLRRHHKQNPEWYKLWRYDWQSLPSKLRFGKREKPATAAEQQPLLEP